MAISNQLRDYIKSKGILIKHVADKANIPQKKMYRMLNGSAKMTVEDFQIICKQGLEVDPVIFLKSDS